MDRTNSIKILKEHEDGGSTTTKNRILEFVSNVNENFAKHESNIIEIRHKITELSEKSNINCVDINTLKKIVTILETTVADIKENILSSYRELDKLETKLTEIQIDYKSQSRIYDNLITQLPSKQEISTVLDKVADTTASVSNVQQSLSKLELENQRLSLLVSAIQSTDIAELRQHITHHTAVLTTVDKSLNHLKEKQISTFKMLKTINGDVRNIIERIRVSYEQCREKDEELKDDIQSTYEKLHKEISAGMNYVMGVTDILSKKIEQLDVERTLKRLDHLEKILQTHQGYIKTIALNLKEIKSKYNNLLEIQDFFITLYNTGMVMIEFIILRKVNRERLQTISKSRSLIAVFIIVTILFYILGVIFGKDGFFYTIYSILREGMSLLKSSG